MTTDEFWMVVDQTRRHAADDAAGLAALTAELARRGERAIAGFERQARREVSQLDAPDLRDVTEQLWVLSDESWFNFRAWCVSQGHDFVSKLMAAPARVLRPVADARSGPFDVPTGELFLYCAEYARVARAVAAA